MVRQFRLIAATLVILGVPVAASAKSIAWLHNFHQAEVTASKTHKLVMLDFYTSWCGWCKVMDAKVYPAAATQKAMQQVIPLRMDAEHNGVAEARKYDIQAFPTVVFLDANGNEYGRVQGYLPTPQFVAQIDQITAFYHKVPQLERSFNASPRNAKLGAQLVQLYAQQGRMGLAAHTLARIPQIHANAQYLYACNINLGRAYANGNKLDTARACFKKALAYSGKPDEKSIAYVYLAFCDAQQHSNVGAKNLLLRAQEVPGVSPGLQAHISQLMTLVSKH